MVSVRIKCGFNMDSSRRGCLAWCIICAISVLGLSAGLAVHFIDVWADREWIMKF